jgi:hypothetical protein
LPSHKDVFLCIIIIIIVITLVVHVFVIGIIIKVLVLIFFFFLRILRFVNLSVVLILDYILPNEGLLIFF